MIDSVSVELGLSCDLAYWKGFLKLWTNEHKSEKVNQDCFLEIIIYSEILLLVQSDSTTVIKALIGLG